MAKCKRSFIAPIPDCCEDQLIVDLTSMLGYNMFFKAYNKEYSTYKIIFTTNYKYARRNLRKTTHSYKNLIY